MQRYIAAGTVYSGRMPDLSPNAQVLAAHVRQILTIASARASFCKVDQTGNPTWPFIVTNVPLEDVTRCADALQRSRYSTRPDHDKGYIWVIPNNFQSK